MRKAFIGAVLVMVLMGCSTPPGQKVDVECAVAQTDPGALFSDGSVFDTDLRRKMFFLGVGDMIDISIANHPEFSGEMAVDGLGGVTIPTVNVRVAAENIDLDQFSDLVAEAIAPFTRTPPRVTTRVLEVRSRFFYALGAVGLQGQIGMPMGQLELRDALVRAGLFLPGQSDTAHVTIITPDVEKPTFVVVDAREVMLGKLKNNVVVKPGDVVYVPNTKLFNFNRFTDALMSSIESIQDLDRAVTFIETAEDGVITRDLDRGRRWVSRGGSKGVPPPEDVGTNTLRVWE